MDPQLVFALSRLSGCAGRAGRIQRQVHVQPIRSARRFLRDFALAYPPDLSKFLSPRKTRAVPGISPRARFTMNPPRAALESEPATSESLADVLAGLTRKPRVLPCKYFYDAR